MRIFLCYVCPPLAVLLCGKPFTAILTFILTIFGWAPGVQHALFIVNNHFQDNRFGKVIKTIDNPKWTQQPKVLPQKIPMRPGPGLIDNPFSWAWRKGEQLGMNHPVVPRSWLPPQPQDGFSDIGDPGSPVDPSDPSIGANGTRFRRKQ